MTNTYVSGSKYGATAHRALKSHQIRALFIRAGWHGETKEPALKVVRAPHFDKGPGVLR